MSGAEKIINRIKSDSQENIKAVIADAEERKASIISAAQAEAEEQASEIKASADKKAIQIKTAAESRAKLEIRTAILMRKRAEIDKTFGMLADYFLSLGDKEYFEVIYKLASKLSGKSGEIILNQRDKDRLPSDFTEQIKNAGLDAVLSDKTADICGGFILKCGDIEENMDFKALIADKQEQAEDFINRELFK